MHGRGIENSFEKSSGNDCFMNACMQLIYFSHLKTFFLNQPLDKIKNEKEQKLLRAIQEFLNGYEKKPLLSTSHFRKLLGFSALEQEDPVNFLTLLMNLCQVESIASKLRKTLHVDLQSLKKSPGSEGVMLDEKGKGQLQMEDYPLFSISCQNLQEKISFSQLWENHFSIQKKNEEASLIYQGSCYESPYSESYVFEVLNPHLLVQLKRVIQKPDSKTFLKNNSKVIIASEEKLGGKGGKQYQLRGFITHIGSLELGHYITYIKFENGWQLFNDQEVAPISEEAVFEAAQDAYLLYFLEKNNK